MCMGGGDGGQKKAQKLSEQQFQWQKEQAALAEQQAADKRAAMASGLAQINKRFAGFNDNYYRGLQNNYLNYANPQIDRSQAKSETSLRSALANRGKLNSSSAATQYGELADTYGGMYRDAQTKSLDYANQQRGAVNQAKQNTISQMYASESPDAALMAASGNVAALMAGPAFEPITATLNQAAKYASMDYNNSLSNPNGQGYGVFSPMFNNSSGGGGGGGNSVKNVYN